MPTLPWPLKSLTRSFPILLEMEEKKYRTDLVIVDQSHHWEGVRTARVLLAHESVSDEIRPGDRVLLRGSNGKTMDGYDKSEDERYRFCREFDIEAVLPEGLEVESVSRR